MCGIVIACNPKPFQLCYFISNYVLLNNLGYQRVL